MASPMGRHGRTPADAPARMTRERALTLRLLAGATTHCFCEQGECAATTTGQMLPTLRAAGGWTEACAKLDLERGHRDRAWRLVGEELRRRVTTEAQALERTAAGGRQSATLS